MAITGSVNFLSASVTGSENIPLDFVGLNTLIVDPVSGSSNHLGYEFTNESMLYFNNDIDSMGDIKATGTVTITDYTELNTSDRVTLTSTAGGATNFTCASSTALSEWSVGSSNEETAANLASAINYSPDFVAVTNGTAVVTITQHKAGAAGNTTITLVDSSTAGMTKTNFAGGSSQPISSALTLNTILLNRNGPYHHPMWKQYRGGEHPVARTLRLNNTMSIDKANPDAKRLYLDKKAFKENYIDSTTWDKDDIYPRANPPGSGPYYEQWLGSEYKKVNKDITIFKATGHYAYPDLKQYYEPVLVDKHKPFVWEAAVGGRSVTARASFMNQMTYFTNKGLNEALKLASGNPMTASTYSTEKQKFYDLFRTISEITPGSDKNFLYTERIFPRDINAYRPFKLKKPNYEEVAGLGVNGYDRTTNRSFWRNAQQNTATSASARGGGFQLTSDGTSRVRTPNTALNSHDIPQKTIWKTAPSADRRMAFSIARDGAVSGSATITFTDRAAPPLLDGNTITLTDYAGNSKTFEFDDAGTGNGDGVAGSNVAVVNKNFGGSDVGTAMNAVHATRDGRELAISLAYWINQQDDLYITALDPGTSSTLILIQDQYGDAGNTAIAVDSTSDWGTATADHAGATITVTDYQELNTGDKITLRAAAAPSTGIDFTAAGSTSGANWAVGGNNDVTATNIATAINNNANFTAWANSSVVYVYQALGPAADGNTTVTLTDAGTDGMTKTDFTGGSSTAAPSSFTGLTFTGGVGPPTTGVHTGSLDLGERTMAYMENGYVMNQANINTLSGALIQPDAYQPYEMPLLSMWPLDPREDVYDTALGNSLHLTSAFGGKGTHIGLTPHRHPKGRDWAQQSTIFHINNAIQTSSVVTHMNQYLTGNAGELVYSTKPTIFFYRMSDTHTKYIMNHVEGGTGYSSTKVTIGNSGGDPANGATVVLVSTDGTSLTYTFVDSGAVDAATRKLLRTGTNAEIVARLKDAINDSQYGHGNKIIADDVEGDTSSILLSQVTLGQGSQNITITDSASNITATGFKALNMHNDGIFNEPDNKNSSQRQLHFPTASAGFPTSSQPSYSTLTAGASDGISGYVNPTASLQFNRHTYPYNTPFYATNKIRGKNPACNSYSDFTALHAREDNTVDMSLLSRDYSIVPEFRISDHLNFYNSRFDLGKNMFRTIYTIVPFDKETEKPSRIERVNHMPAGYVDADNNLEHKLNFLTIDGADITSSANADHVDEIASVPSSSPTTWYRYRYDDLAGAYSTTSGLSIPEYSSDSGSVIFAEKYSHTDPTEGFANLAAVPGGFANFPEVVPSKITFTCHGIKKFLPYNGFYPVLRTVQIGKNFKDMWAKLPWKGFYGAGQQPAGQSDVDAAYLQTLLEPFMAPGILYNSIKSGIAVDYPIYTNFEDTAELPYYYAPEAFGYEALKNKETGSRPPVKRAFYSSSYYGGLNMMGSSRCHPAIMRKMYTKRLPFETIYNPKFMRRLTAPQGASTEADTSTAKGTPTLLYMPSDFVDYDRCYPASLKNTAYFLTGSPQVQFNNKYEDQYLRDVGYSYYSSINNFLCETMDFFLDDQHSSMPGVKLPIALSEMFQDDEISFVQSKTTYNMDVTLQMGLHNVMCEGPRRAGVGLFHNTDIFQGTSGTDSRKTNKHYTNYHASLRGYIYGPPMEIVGHISDAEVTSDSYVDYDGKSSTAKTARVLSNDYAGYFGVNLQDPAYQSHTPPYFYGKSSMTVRFNAANLSDFTVFGALAGIVDDATKNSYYRETYNTGSSRTDETRLCHQIPNQEDSVSSGSLSRMKIDSSLQIIKNDNVIALKHHVDGETDTNVHSIWNIAPKWVCPVLDFSSSYTPYEYREVVQGTGENPRFSTKPKIGTVQNLYHDHAGTGRGLWGGYGMDPYDNKMLEKLKEVMIADQGMKESVADQIIKQKGLYMAIEDSVKNATTENKQKTTATFKTTTTNEDEYSANKSEFEDYTTADPQVQSLAELLGFSTEALQVGRISKEGKSVYEAIALVPYFEKPIRIMPKFPEIVPGGEFYQTREIIPGKHFLPIQKDYFENLLSVTLGVNLYPKGDFRLGDLHDGNAFPFANDQDNITKYDPLHKAVYDSDTGRLISTLLGYNKDYPKCTGFQLPPEFDFVRNAAVNPFQMIVIPFKHQFSKQDLVDMYQGLMPEIGTYLEKVTNRAIIKPAGANTGILSPMIPTYSPQETAQIYSLSNTTGFLNPSFLQKTSTSHHIINSNESTMFGYDLNAFPAWKSPTHEFYKNLRFMVFKIKQIAEKDYDFYRKGQIARAIENTKLPKHPMHRPDEGQYFLFKDQSVRDALTNKTLGQVYGSNWPYDYFSLIETIKIDIGIEVTR